MKRNKYHIIHTWMLLLCFVAGQFMVYSHQHKFAVSRYTTGHNLNNHPQQTVTENCRLCDAMHHNTITLNSQAHFAPVVVSNYTYKAVVYNFVSIPLILSAGRSPPMA